jgi:hypothetical protein
VNDPTLQQGAEIGASVTALEVVRRELLKVARFFAAPGCSWVWRPLIARCRAMQPVTLGASIHRDTRATSFVFNQSLKRETGNTYSVHDVTISGRVAAAGNQEVSGITG